MKKQYHLTTEGLAELQGELERLTANRTKIAEDIATARSQGDLAENAEYQSAKEEQSRNEARIEEVTHIVQNAEIIKGGKSNGKVGLGSTVKLKSKAGKPKEFQVVGTVEADPLNGKISDESPIGQALIGKKQGEEVEIKTPADTTVYTIESIS